MDTQEIMDQLANIGLANFATIDEEGRPHVRPIHIGVADQNGVYFMTSPETKFYQQMINNPHIAISAYGVDDYLIQVIRIEGKVQPVNKDQLERLLTNNPYVNRVYPDADQRSHMQVFHLYYGEGFYHSLTQGHKYTFNFGQEIEA